MWNLLHDYPPGQRFLESVSVGDLYPRLDLLVVRRLYEHRPYGPYGLATRATPVQTEALPEEMQEISIVAHYIGPLSPIRERS